MASQEIESIPSEELETLLALEGLGDADEVTSLPDGYSVSFPEADFVIRVSSPTAGPCETEWEVTVREPRPGLSTWWGRWHRSFTVHHADAGPLIAAEVRESLSWVRNMLDDRARVLQDAGMPGR